MKEVWGNGAERPRLVQTQCWCPRDVRESYFKPLFKVGFPDANDPIASDWLAGTLSPAG